MMKNHQQLLKVIDQDCRLYLDLQQDEGNNVVYWINIWKQNPQIQFIQRIQIDYFRSYCWSGNSSHLIIVSRDAILVYYPASVWDITCGFHEQYHLQPTKSFDIQDMQCSFPLLYVRTPSEVFVINLLHSYYHVLSEREIGRTKPAFIASLSYDGKFLAVYNCEDRLRIISLDVLLSPSVAEIKDNLNKTELQTTDLVIDSIDPIVELIFRSNNVIEGVQLLVVVFESGKLQVYEVFYEQQLEDETIVAIALNAAINAGVVNANDRSALNSANQHNQNAFSVSYCPITRLVFDLSQERLLHMLKRESDGSHNELGLKTRGFWLNGILPAISSVYSASKSDLPQATEVQSKANSAHAMFGMSVKKKKGKNEANHLWLVLHVLCQETSRRSETSSLLLLGLQQEFSANGSQLVISENLLVSVRAADFEQFTSEVVNVIGIFSHEKGTPSHVEICFLNHSSSSSDGISVLSRNTLDLTLKREDRACAIYVNDSIIVKTTNSWYCSGKMDLSWTTFQDKNLIIAKNYSVKESTVKQVLLFTKLSQPQKILEIREFRVHTKERLIAILLKGPEAINISVASYNNRPSCPLSADTLEEEPEIDGGHHDFYSVEIIPDLHFGLGIRLDEGLVDSNDPSAGTKVTVSSFKPHPVTKEPMAAELSGLIHSGDELIAINDTIFYHRPLSEVIPTVRNLLSSTLPDQTVKLRFLRSNSSTKTNADLEHFIKDHEKRELNQAISQKSQPSSGLHEHVMPFEITPLLTTKVFERDPSIEICSLDCRSYHLSAHHKNTLIACIVKKDGKVFLRLYELKLKYDTDLAAKHTNINWETMQTGCCLHTRLKLRSSKLTVQFNSSHQESHQHDFTIADFEAGREKRYQCFQFRESATSPPSWRLLPQKSTKTEIMNNNLSDVRTSSSIVALKTYAHLRDNATAYHNPDLSTTRHGDDSSGQNRDHLLALTSPFVSILLSPYLTTSFSVTRKASPFHTMITQLISFRPSTTSNILSLNFKDVKTLENLAQENVLHKLSNYFHGKVTTILSESAIQFTLQVIYEMNTRYKYSVGNFTIGDQSFSSSSIFYIYLISLSLSNFVTLSVTADIPNQLQAVLEEFHVQEESPLSPVDTPPSSVKLQTQEDLKEEKKKERAKKVLDYEDGFDSLDSSDNDDDDHSSFKNRKEERKDGMNGSFYNNQHYEVHLLSKLSALIMNLFTASSHHHSFDHYSTNVLWHMQYQKSWILVIRQAAESLLKLKKDIFGKGSSSKAANSENLEDSETEGIDLSLEKKGAADKAAAEAAAVRPMQWNDLAMTDVANLFFSSNQSYWYQVFFSPIAVHLEESPINTMLTEPVTPPPKSSDYSATAQAEASEKEKEKAKLLLALGCALVFNTTPAELTLDDILKIDLLTYMSSLKINFWLHDLQPILGLIYKHCMKKYRVYKSSMKIFLEMVIIGRMDTLLNIAKVDSSKTGKMLVTLLLMVEEAFNPYNTDKEKLVKLQNTLRKNAFALIRKQMYREAAAVFLLCPTVAMVRAAQSVLAQQNRSPFLAQLVSRLVETRLNLAVTQSGKSDKEGGGSFASSLSETSYNKHLFASIPDSILENTQALLDRSSYVLGVFSSEIVKKDILPGLIAAARQTIEQDKYNFPFEGKTGMLLDDHTPIHINTIGYHGMKDFSAIILAIICSIWLQEEDILRSTFDSLLPLMRLYFEKITIRSPADPAAINTSSTSINIITLSERWEKIILYKHSFQFQYKLSHLHLIMQFLESTFASTASNFAPASIYYPHQMIKVIHSLSFFMDASYFLPKEYTGKMITIVHQVLSNYQLSTEQLQLHLYYQSCGQQEGAGMKRSKYLRQNAFYKYSKRHYQKVIHQINRSTINDAKFTNHSLKNNRKVSTTSDDSTTTAEETAAANKLKFNFASLSLKPALTSALSAVNAGESLSAPTATSVEVIKGPASMLDMGFPNPPSNTKGGNIAATSKSALDLFDTAPVRRPAKEVSPPVDPFFGAGKSALDSFDPFISRSSARPVPKPAAGPPSALDTFDTSSYSRPSKPVSITSNNAQPEAITHEEGRDKIKSALDTFDAAYERPIQKEAVKTEGANEPHLVSFKNVDDKDKEQVTEQIQPEEVHHEKNSNKDSLSESHSATVPVAENKTLAGPAQDVPKLEPLLSQSNLLVLKGTGNDESDSKSQPIRNIVKQSETVLKSNDQDEKVLLQPFPSSASQVLQDSKITETVSAPTLTKGLLPLPTASVPPKSEHGIIPIKTSTGQKVNSAHAAKSVEQRVHAFYEKYNPTKVSSIPSILDKYKGKEQELLDKLQKQYNAPYI